MQLTRLAALRFTGTTLAHIFLSKDFSQHTVSILYGPHELPASLVGVLGKRCEQFRKERPSMDRRYETVHRNSTRRCGGHAGLGPSQ
jgi:hypothetical protein